jgi:uncharacterized membrane protein YebE (DUF533 family)
MFDVKTLLDNLQNNPSTQKSAMTAGGGALAGFAAAMLMGKGGGKVLGSAAKYGSIAAIGGLAYHAWQKHQAAKGQAVNPTSATEMTPQALARTAFLPSPDAVDETEALARSLVRAMIAAAKADGEIDGKEKAVIFERLNAMELDAGAKAFVFDELSNPADINKVVADVRSPEHGVEIYAASVMAIDVDSPAEKAYLAMLAARLGLEDGLVEEIHNSIKAA